MSFYNFNRLLNYRNYPIPVYFASLFSTILQSIMSYVHIKNILHNVVNQNDSNWQKKHEEKPKLYFFKSAPHITIENCRVANN